MIVSEIFQHSPQPNVALQELLKQFASVFDTAKGLTPNTGHEHQILLKEGIQPIRVRPYRYPFYQKNEKEKDCARDVGNRVNKI